MPDILNSKPGTVAIIELAGDVVPGKVTVKGFAPKAALVAGVNYLQRTNQQFQTALDGAVYIYVFGDHMGAIEVHGMAFSAPCSAGGKSGLVEVLKFYEGTRASINAVPISIQIGEETIKGFLTTVRIESQTGGDDPASFMSRFTLGINAMPKKG